MPADQTNSFYESHTIETPEQTDLSFAIAGIGSRFVALVVDTLVQGVVLIVAVILLAIFGVALRSAGAWFVGAFVVLLFLLFYGYFVLFEIFWNGQTPGKRAFGIRVIKDSGRRLNPIETIGRNLLRIIDQLPGFYAVGIVVALLNKRNKRLGDFVAGSIVIRETHAAASTLPQIAQPDWTYTRIGAERLSEEDLILIESFLHRRSQLPPDIRARMAEEVLRKVEARLSFSSEDRLGVERLLEAAVYERRSHLE